MTTGPRPVRANGTRLLAIASSTKRTTSGRASVDAPSAFDMTRRDSGPYSHCTLHSRGRHPRTGRNVLAGTGHGAERKLAAWRSGLWVSFVGQHRQRDRRLPDRSPGVEGGARLTPLLGHGAGDDRFRSGVVRGGRQAHVVKMGKLGRPACAKSRKPGLSILKVVGTRTGAAGTCLRFWLGDVADFGGEPLRAPVTVRETPGKDRHPWRDRARRSLCNAPRHAPSSRHPRCGGWALTAPLPGGSRGGRRASTGRRRRRRCHPSRPGCRTTPRWGRRRPADRRPPC